MDTVEDIRDRVDVVDSNMRPLSLLIAMVLKNKLNQIKKNSLSYGTMGRLLAGIAVRELLTFNTQRAEI